MNYINYKNTITALKKRGVKFKKFYDLLDVKNEAIKHKLMTLE
jgi:hypothetical protein